MTGQNTAPREPLFNIPPMTGGLILLLLVVHLGRLFLLSDAQDMHLIFGWGFIPHRLTTLNPMTFIALSYNGMTMLTYMLFHIGWTHFFLNTGSLLAFGTAVEKGIGAWSMLALFILCGVAGVLTHYVIYPDSVAPVVGASAAISGLFGGSLRVM